VDGSKFSRRAQIDTIGREDKIRVLQGLSLPNVARVLATFPAITWRWPGCGNTQWTDRKRDVEGKTLDKEMASFF
jgi:hypothetical protein